MNDEIPTLPDDLETPNKPNGVDLQTLPAVKAEELPFDPEKDDPWTTLPGDPKKYELSSDEWRAVPLNKGVHKLISKEKGQIVYIAEDAKGTGTLRVTKEFNIETTGRTAVYLRGQSDLDIAIEELTKLLASKADKEDVYTKEETDLIIVEKIEEKLAGITNVLVFKGVVANESALTTIQNPKTGDTYQTQDTGEFFTWVDTPSPSWQKLSGSIIDLTDYYTKGEIDLLLVGKTDETDFKQLVERVDLLFLRKSPFEYVSSEDPAGAEEDKTEVGEAWFKKDTGEIFIRKLSEIDQTKYWLNSTDNLALKLGRQFVKLESDQTIKGVKTFNDTIKSLATPTANEDVVNKAYVDNAIANVSGGGGGVIPSDNLVTTNTEQIITGNKIFRGKVKVNEPIENEEVASKYYVDDKIQKLTQSPLPDYVTLSTAQTISGVKTFESNAIPKLNNYTAGVFNDDSFITQKRAKELIKNDSGAEVILEDVAKLSDLNDFKALNTFRAGIISVEAITQSAEPTNADHLTTKSYVDTSIENIDIPEVDLTNYATLNTEQTITASKTFEDIVFYTPTPMQETEIVNKLYVDTAIADIGGGKPIEIEAKLLELNVDYNVASSVGENLDKGVYTITFLKDIFRNVIALNETGEEVFITKVWDISDKVKLIKCFTNSNTISLIMV